MAPSVSHSSSSTCKAGWKTSCAMRSPRPEPSFLAGRIEEDDGDFAAVVGINDADALRHGQALHGSEPAA